MTHPELARTRQQVFALRRHRMLVRWGTALAPLMTGLLLVLGAFWAIDFIFQLDASQRTAMLAVCALVLLWVYRRYTRPLLGKQESLVDVALLVEKQHRLDSDLVAALQFDGSPAIHYGSPQLEAAVIHQAAELGKQIDFFDGTSYEQFSRRALALALVVMLAVASAVVYPNHVRVFFQRLLLGADHYPTRTVIETITVNGRVVLTRGQQATHPEDCAAAQGQPVNVLVRCIEPTREAAGPSQPGELRIAGVAGGRTVVPLEPLTLDQRFARLEEAVALIQNAAADPSLPVDERWLDEVAPTIAFDAPLAKQQLLRARQDRAALDAAIFEIRRVKGAWPGPAADFSLYHGQLDRLIESVEYQLQVRDAWTDPARIEMIALPVVTLDLQVVPPAYAASENLRKPSASHQLSVLEGSDIQLALTAANEKELAEAWVRVSTKTNTSRWELTRAADPRNSWRLEGQTPFVNVSEEFSFEVQVRDTDGLRPESPLRGYVRLRTDRPPTATMELVHRVVLPTARPVVSFRATDDFGISRLVLHLAVQRPHNETRDAELSSAAEERDVPLESDWLPADQLPYSGRHEVDLAALGLVKGDQLKLTLEAIDYRGEDPGKTSLSEPVVLDISDEAGVLAAIAEADETSEERLTEVIKEQLGIGDKQ